MAVRIRLSRGGSKKRPYYHIVAADQRAPRDGRYIEKLGAYNPLLPQDNEKRIVVDQEKVAAWLAKGAQPTERLQKIFANLGLCAAPKAVERPKKSAPKAKAIERIKAKEAKAAEAAAAIAAESVETEAAATVESTENTEASAE